jgi:hypothetical protein
LQQVQREIGEPITDFEFLTTDPGVELADLAPDNADHTRIRPVVIRAQGARPDQDGATRMRGAAGPDPTEKPVNAGGPDGRSENTVLRGRPTTGSYLDVPTPDAPAEPDTVVPARPAATTAPAPARKKRTVPLALGAAALVVAAGLTWIVVAGGTGNPALDTTGTATTMTSDPALAVVDVVPQPAGLTGTVTPDGVTFTWTNPDPQPGDGYDWQRTKTGQAETVSRVTEPAVTIPGATQACIEVVIVRDNGSSSVRPADACVGK